MQENTAVHFYSPRNCRWLYRRIGSLSNCFICRRIGSLWNCLDVQKDWIAMELFWRASLDHCQTVLMCRKCGSLLKFFLICGWFDSLWNCLDMQKVWITVELSWCTKGLDHYGTVLKCRRFGSLWNCLDVQKDWITMELFWCAGGLNHCGTVTWCVAGLNCYETIFSADWNHFSN